MKKSKLVLAAASLILAGVSIAATKPMRLVQSAYVHNSSSECVTVQTPCALESGVNCTTINVGGVPQVGVSVYQDQGNCVVPFTKVAPH